MASCLEPSCLSAEFKAVWCVYECLQYNISHEIQCLFKCVVIIKPSGIRVCSEGKNIVHHILHFHFSLVLFMGSRCADDLHHEVSRVCWGLRLKRICMNTLAWAIWGKCLNKGKIGRAVVVKVFVFHNMCMFVTGLTQEMIWFICVQLWCCWNWNWTHDMFYGELLNRRI